MKQLKLLLVSMFTFLAISNTNAQDENNPWAIGFGVNAVDFIFRSVQTSTADHFKDLTSVKDFNVLPSISKIYAEKYLNKGFSLQLAGSLNKITYFEAENDSDFLYYSIDASVKYDLNKLFGKTGWFDPYVHLGGSFVSVDDSNFGLVTYGAGFNTWFNESIGLNIHTGAKDSFDDDQLRSHWQHSVGIVIKFGGKDSDSDGIYDKNDECPEVAGLKEFNGCPDSDGDGIKDSDDSCPEVAGLASMNGCPDTDGDGIADKDDMCPNEKGTKANKGCPDTDGDGVVDKDDKCPTVAGPVANAGCPWPDTDGDGVLDKDDKCPNEVGPSSKDGCPEVISKDAETSLTELPKSIVFNTGKSTFKPGVTDKLDLIFDIMNTNYKANFLIEGHTDSTGSDALNLNLSNARASAVKTYLVKKGIDTSRLETKGFGENQPIAPNNTVEGRAQNRRVVVKVTNK